MSKIKIGHTADIHIRGFSYMDEINYTFDRFYESLKENEVDVIVVAGDIYHSKLTVTNEYFTVARKFFDTLRNIAPTIIIPGNHDLALNNLSRLDAISPVYESLIDNSSNPLKEENIYYSKYSEAISYKDVYFYHFSMLDPKSKWPHKKWLEDDKINIALYHGSIDGSVYDNDQIVKGNKDDSSLFNGFDYALLGDIHKHQFIAPNIAYPGSLRQNSYGESLDKGYLLWNIEGKKFFDVEHIVLPQKKYFITLYTDTNKVPGDLEISPGNRIRVVLQNDITFAEELKIKNFIKRTYKPCNDVPVQTPRQKISLDFVNIEGKEIQNKNLRKPEVQKELISAFLIKQGIDNDQLIKSVTDLDIHYHSYIDTDILRNITWELQTLEWANLFAFGEENKINLSKLKGLIGLFGENGLGKSSILDIICYCLTNTINKKGAIKNGTYVNLSKTDAYANIIANLDKDKYYIQRKTSCKKSKLGTERVVNEIDFFVNKKSNSKNGESLPDTNNNIRKVFGSRDDLVIINMAPQWDLTKFIDTRDTDRKKALGRFLDLGVFEDKYNIAIEDFKKIKKKLEEHGEGDYEHKLLDYKQTISEIESKIKENEKDKKKIKEAITNFQIEKSKLNPYKSISVRNSKVINKDIESFKSSKKAFEQGLELLLSKQVNSKINVDDQLDISEFENKLDELELKLGMLKNTKSKTDLLIERSHLLNQVPCGDEYPTCSFIKVAHEAKKKLKELKSQQEIEKEIENVINKIQELKIAIKDYREAIKISNSIKEHRSLLKDIDEKLSVLEKEKVQAESHEEYPNIEIKLKELENKINDLEKRKESLNKDFVLYNQEIGKLQEKYSQAQAAKTEYDELHDKYEIYQIYLECMGKNGISYWILSQKLPVINSEINRILKEVTDFRVLVHDNKEDKKIELFIINQKNEKTMLELACGQEKTMASLAIMTAMWSICSLPKCSTLFLDETFSYLDEKNQHNISRFFDILKEYYKNIVFITHNEEMKTLTDHIVYVTRNEEGFSECKNE